MGICGVFAVFCLVAYLVLHPSLDFLDEKMPFHLRGMSGFGRWRDILAYRMVLGTKTDKIGVTLGRIELCSA